jgi:hypothetical protein
VVIRFNSYFPHPCDTTDPASPPRSVVSVGITSRKILTDGVLHVGESTQPKLFSSSRSTTRSACIYSLIHEEPLTDSQPQASDATEETERTRAQGPGNVGEATPYQCPCCAAERGVHRQYEPPLREGRGQLILPHPDGVPSFLTVYPANFDVTLQRLLRPIRQDIQDRDRQTHIHEPQEPGHRTLCHLPQEGRSCTVYQCCRWCSFAWRWGRGRRDAGKLWNHEVLHDIPSRPDLLGSRLYEPS